jgi:hypothetical protein
MRPVQRTYRIQCCVVGCCVRYACGAGVRACLLLLVRRWHSGRKGRQSTASGDGDDRSARKAFSRNQIQRYTESEERGRSSTTRRVEWWRSVHGVKITAR